MNDRSAGAPWNPPPLVGRDLRAEARHPSTSEAVRAAARGLAQRLDDVHAELMRAVLERVPVAEDGAHLVTAVSDAVVANLETFLATVGHDRTGEVRPLPEDLRCVEQLARAGRPADDLLRIYRTVQAAFEVRWRGLLRHAAADADAFAEADASTSRRIFEVADAVVPALLQHHAAVGRREPAAVRTRHTVTIRRVLADPDVDVRAASARLRYELDRWHVAVAAAVAPATDADEACLDRVATAVEAAAGSRPLLAAPGADVLHLWVGAAGEPGPLDLPAVPGAVLAVGRPARGIEGFRRTRYEAVRALDLARGMGRPGGTVTTFAELEVVSLLWADPAEATRFADGVLGEVRAGDGGPDLVRTLAVLYEEDLNLGRTAERLGVHRNTVAYRVRRALELSGESHAFALRLRAAVELSPLLGPDDAPRR